LNITGGKWIIRLKKGVSDRIWEDLILAVVGDQFDECGTPAPAPEGAPEGEWPEICGCTISVRQSEDIISLWNRFDDPKVREKIRYEKQY
jgi:translation initiation factor 4E